MAASDTYLVKLVELDYEVLADGVEDVEYNERLVADARASWIVLSGRV